jgi:hypothetical protein
MKRFSLIICLVLILSLSRVASAQIVLGPQAAGGLGHLIKLDNGSTVVDTYFFTGPYVGNPVFGSLGSIYKKYYLQVAVEFNLQGGTTNLPTADMTSNNFTARLSGLTATDSWGTGSLNLYLYDMGDGTEDGNVYYNDFNSTQGALIASSAHVIVSAPAVFNNIDVTNAVRNDLFGGGPTDFSGFILLCPDAPAPERHVSFNLVTPTLTIHIDKDGDSYEIPNDCDDNDDLVNPDAAEVCDDGIDNECDGLLDCYDTDDCGSDLACTDCTDGDGDGYYNIDAGCSGSNDCDDSDKFVNPGATEICDDFTDNDCNGYIDEFDAYCIDSDGDGYTPSENDCNDNDASINPGVAEVCDDGIDNDCDGDIDSADSKCIDAVDSSCFISSVASLMEPHVKVLQGFRDRYMNNIYGVRFGEKRQLYN